MRRQKCTQCGTMLDITKLEQGAKFACASCGAILVVGEAVAVKRSLKESGPAFTPKGKQEAPAPARAKRRAAEGGEEGGGRAPRKSRLPLYLAIGAVAVAGVVAIAVSGGGAGGGGAKGPTAVEWWAQKSAMLGSATPETLRAWMKEATDLGFTRDTAFWAPKEEEIYRQILKRAPADLDANVRAGNKPLKDYPGLEKVWARMDEQYKRLPPDLKEFFDKLEPQMQPGAEVFLTPAQYAEAAARLDAFVAWDAKQAENPAGEAIDRFTAQARTVLATAQRKVGFVALSEAPFVLLLAYEENAEAETSKAQLDADGRKWTAALRLAREEFDRRFREPLGLPAPEGGKYSCAVVVPTQEDLSKFVRGEGYDATGDIPAFFSTATRWIHLREPKEAAEKSLFGGDLAHAAVHQLQWHCSADPKNRLFNYMTEWTGIWLTEGLAEYVGGGIDLDPGSGKATFSGRPPRRAEFLQAMRDNGVPLIPLQEIVQLSSAEDFERYVGGTWHASIVGNEDMPEAAGQWIAQQPGLALKILYAQSWLLVHFLHEAEDGKYRVQLLDLVLTAFRGKQKPEKYRKDANVPERFASADEAFRTIFGIKDQAAWTELQRAHDRHLKQLLRGD